MRVALLLISEVDRKLDRMCVLALRQDTLWFKMASRMESSAPAFIFQDSDKTFLQIYFPKDHVKKSDISAIMASPSGTEKDAYYTVTERINNVKHLSIISEIMDLPTVVAINSYLREGELFVAFRFHRSVIDDVEAHLVTLLELNGYARIVYMGNSPGIITLLDRINSDTPVSVVQYSFDISSEAVRSHPLLTAARSGSDVLAEVDVRQSTPEGARTIIYSKYKLSAPFSVLSEEDCIYETTTNIAPFMEGRKRGNEARIPRIAVFLGAQKDRLVDTTFVPTSEAGEYISQYFGMMSGMKKGELRLETFSPLTKESWEWL